MRIASATEPRSNESIEPSVPMAMIFLGRSRCSLCGEVRESDQEIRGMPAIGLGDPRRLTNEEHPFQRYVDSGMHLDCFLEWPESERVVVDVNAQFDRHHRSMVHMLPDAVIERREPQGQRDSRRT